VSSRAPLYVLQIDADSGSVTVGARESLERTSFTASGVNWMSIDEPREWVRAAAQIRHRHRPSAGRVRALPNSRAEFEFDLPHPAIAPGQAAVFYDGDVVVGGGWIDGR
jgi:tRNA-specific 2-thiouridylase